jgi:hypothetical protein
MATRPNMRTLQMQDTIGRYGSAIRQIRTHADKIMGLLDVGDERLLASDGPAGGKLPDLSPEEWGEVYRACLAIARVAEAVTQ